MRLATKASSSKFEIWVSLLTTGDRFTRSWIGSCTVRPPRIPRRMSPSVMTPASFLSRERITTVVMLWVSNRFSMSEIRTSSKSCHREKAASVCLMNLYSIAVPQSLILLNVPCEPLADDIIDLHRADAHGRPLDIEVLPPQNMSAFQARPRDD